MGRMLRAEVLLNLYCALLGLVIQLEEAMLIKQRLGLNSGRVVDVVAARWTEIMQRLES